MMKRRETEEEEGYSSGSASDEEQVGGGSGGGGGVDIGGTALPAGEGTVAAVAGAGIGAATVEGESAAEDGSIPVFSFGLVADIQHSLHKDVGMNFKKTKRRFYTAAVDTLRRGALQTWKQDDGTPAVDFVLQLGDIVDGKNRDNGTQEQALHSVLDAFAEELPAVPVHHALGNHELFCFTEERFCELVDAHPVSQPNLSGTPSVAPKPMQLQYSFEPHPRWRFLNVNTFGLSALANDAEARAKADELILTHNTNDDKYSCEGLADDKRRFVRYGGGLSSTQVDWLRSEIRAAREAGQFVVIFSHIPFARDATAPQCLIWNSEEVLTLLHEEGQGTVRLVCSGHTHDSYHHHDEVADIHHLTLDCILECDPEQNEQAFATVHVFDDHLRVVGADKIPSLRISLP